MKGYCQISFFYNPIMNIFIDADGFVVYEIFRLVSPGQLILFKKNKKDMTLKHKGNIITLYWTNRDGIILDHNDETNKLGNDIEKYEREKWYANY